MAEWLEKVSIRARGPLIGLGVLWLLLITFISVIGAMVAYTMLSGERATAYVSECVRVGPGGTYSGSLSDQPVAFSPVVLVITLCSYFWLWRRFRREDSHDSFGRPWPEDTAPSDSPATSNVRVIPAPSRTTPSLKRRDQT